MARETAAGRGGTPHDILPDGYGVFGVALAGTDQLALPLGGPAMLSAAQQGAGDAAAPAYATLGYARAPGDAGAGYASAPMGPTVPLFGHGAGLDDALTETALFSQDAAESGDSSDTSGLTTLSTPAEGTLLAPMPLFDHPPGSACGCTNCADARLDADQTNDSGSAGGAAEGSDGPGPVEGGPNDGHAISTYSYSGENAIDSLLATYKWGGGLGTGTTLTYSFGTSSSVYASGYSEPTNGFGEFSDHQKEMTRMALDFWSNVADIAFTEVTDSATVTGDLRFAKSSEPSTAWAYYPTTSPVGGDVWVGPSSNYSDMSLGTYGFQTMLHEIGHALGLSHAHQGSVTADAGTDWLGYTVMSYKSYSGASTGYRQNFYPTTPMSNDIAAIQYLYGANGSFNSGDTAYSWGVGDSIFEAIWDSGGIDTIDWSNQSTGAVINLNSGEWSELGPEYAVDYTVWPWTMESRTLMIADGATIENATGGSGDDVITGNAADNELNGGAGDDTLAGGDGDDTFVFGAGFGDDTIGDFAAGAVSDDRIDITWFGISSFATLLDGIADIGGNAVITLSGNTITLTGVTKSALHTDDFTGLGTGATEDADTITGTSGDDIIDALGGNDIIDGGAGADAINGGVGTDTVSYANSSAGVTIGLSGNAGSGGDAEGDTLTNIENVTGSAFADRIDGGAGDNVLSGGAGNDTITGGPGADTLNGGDGDDELIGGTGNDTLDGGDGADALDGSGGADAMAGGGGDDSYTVNDAGDTVTENANEGTDTVNAGVSYAIGHNIENLTLTGSADIDATGNGLHNTLTGNSGNNTLSGDVGNDTLDGGAGDDVLIGGAGSDTYIVDSTSDTVTENVGEGNDTVQSSVNWTLGDNIENLTLTGSADLIGIGNGLDNTINGNSGENVLSGGDGADTISGGAGNDSITAGADNDVIDGGAGADEMFGGAGDDIYIVDDAGDTVVEASSQGSDLVQASVSFTLSPNVENLTLTGSGDIDGTGNALDNAIIGNAGDNVLVGGGGADALKGGAGADTASYATSGAGVAVSLDGTAGSGGDAAGDTLVNIENIVGSAYDDTIYGGAGDNVLTGGGGDDRILGGPGTDTLDGGDGNDTLAAGSGDDTLSGGSGADWLDGGAGADSMTGGTGDDTYFVDDAGDTVTEASSGGTDTVRASVTWTLGDNIENLELLLSADIDGTGSALDNTIIGNSGNNTLDGGAGDDTINAGSGDDIIVGSAGADAINGGSGADTVTYAAAAAAVTIDMSGGASSGSDAEGDTLINVEIVIGSAYDDTIYGNSDDNLLSGGAGHDRIFGGPGADTLSGGDGNDTLAGGSGADSMAGSGGDDTYIVDNIADTVTEKAAEGTDTAETSVTWTLGDNIENLILTGAGNIDGAGNALNNTITGNYSDNILTGGDGDDVLDGRGGDDTLIGGAGADTINGGAGTDTASYAAAGAAVIVNLSGNVSSGSDAEGDTLINIENLIGSDHDDTLYGNAIANVLTGGDGNDRIFASAGDDLVYGGAGDDVIAGGSGNDSIAGGGGADQIYGQGGQNTFIYNAISEAGDMIVDFTAGSDGDVMDVSALLASFGYAGSDAFADGYLRTSQSGADTLVQVDGDGGGDDYLTLATLQGVNENDLAVGNWTV